METIDDLKNRIKELEDALTFCVYSTDESVRINIAKAGIAMDKLEKDKSPFVRKALVENGYNLDTFLFDNSFMVREAVANQGYGLDYLINDKDYRVRKAVAKNNNLKTTQILQLTNDPNPEVRAEIAKKGLKLDILCDDESDIVRAEVAKRGYRLTRYSKDSSSLVRRAVANQGYAIKYLINDPDENVRREASLYGFKHKDAKGLWIIKGNKHVCSICGFKETKYIVATQRCPICNFYMSNYNEIITCKKKSK